MRLAVCAAPADPVPKLVYADWLDDAGRPAQACYIRLLQGAVHRPFKLRCTAASARYQAGAGFWGGLPCGTCDACDENRRRHAADRCQKADPTLKKWARLGVGRCGYGRANGFVSSISASFVSDVVAAVDDGLFALQPVERVFCPHGRPSLLDNLGYGPLSGQCGVFFTPAGSQLAAARLSNWLPMQMSGALGELPNRHPVWGGTGEFFVALPTETDATSYLSDLVVAYGRGRHGLPPLPSRWRR